MAESDLDYAKVTGRFALTIADGGDAGDNPDILYCDEGTVEITPLVTFTKVAGATPAPFTAGNAVITATIDSNGYLSFNGKQYVYVVDLTSSKVNPQIGANKATHRVTFKNVRAGGTPVAFPSTTVRITQGGPAGDGVNDLTMLMPVDPGVQSPIYRGERGIGIAAAAVVGLGNLQLELTDGSTVDAGPLPVGPGGTDAGVASYLATSGTQARAAARALVAGDVANPASQVGGALAASYVRKPQTVIDICSAPYNCKPGDDITTALQGAINTLAAGGQSGKVLISDAGTYTLNGALQTGSYTGSAGQSDTQGGGSTHTWNAQVIFPAVPYKNVKCPAITIEGGVDPSMGWKFTGDAQGVTIVSTITSGHMFETASGYDGWGRVWTGIMPIFRNLVLRLPDNPTAGAINIAHALRTRIERVAVLTTNSWVIPTGDPSTAVGITLPQTYENGDASVRDVNVRGYPSAFRISEHTTFDNVQIVGCNTAFIAKEGGHRNYLAYVDCEQVERIFAIEGSASPAGAVSVYGFLDVEPTTAGLQTLVDRATNAPDVLGCIAYGAGLSGSPGARGASASLNVTYPNAQGVNSSTTGWTDKHPRDTFVRSSGHGIDGKALGAPGYTFPTMHPWRILQGDFTIDNISGSSGSIRQKTGQTSSRCAMPTLDGRFGGRARSIEGTFTVPASGSYTFALLGCRRYDANDQIYGQVKNGTAYIGVGAFASGSGVVSAAGAVSNGQTVTMRLEIHYKQGKPAKATLFLNDAQVLTTPLTTAQIASLTSSTTLPGMEDGIAFADSDTTTTMTNFVVRDIRSDDAINSGTATLAAGTVTISDPNVTLNTVVRLNRQTAGGTLGQLSVAVTAGTGFTINSSSNTDTSSIYYEIPNYGVQPTTTLGITSATPLAGYSPARRVVSTYSGPLVRIRRASDAVEQDFSGSTLDTSAVSTFLGTSDGFVVTIYDQSGRGKHITQPTNTKQPKIATAGTVITSGGKPAVTFDGTDDILGIYTAGLGVFAAGAATSCAVVNAANPGASRRFWTESVSSLSAAQYALQQPDVGDARAMPVMTTAFASSDTTKRGTASTFNGALHQLSSTDNGAALSQWLDGANDLNAAAYTRPGESGKDRFAVGGVLRSGTELNFGMTLSELVIWGTALGTTDRQTAEANQKAFYGTP